MIVHVQAPVLLEIVCASKDFLLPRRFDHDDDLAQHHSRQQQEPLSPVISQTLCPSQGQVQWVPWELMRALLFDGLV